MDLSALNANSQPPDSHRVFNNWSVIPEAWYFAFRSSDLSVGEVKSLQIQQQRVVVFRGEDGNLGAMDAFCPHMGMDLSLGKVQGNHLRCFFHHWEYGTDARCKRIPAIDKLSSSDQATDSTCSENRRTSSAYRARDSDVGLRSYPVCEKYGLVWIYSGRTPVVPVLEVPDLEGREVVVHLGRLNHNKSHHHISMINGLDPQHLKTVHALSIEMDIQVIEEKNSMEFVLSGPTPKVSFIDRVMHFLFGPKYSFSMKYSQASMASLTLLRDVQLGNWKWPRLHMIYAYRPVREGLCQTQPIYLTEKRAGIWGRLVSAITILGTMAAYHFLKDEDDKVYDHIRFDSRRLLAMDEPIKRYVSFVNRLTPSIWSASASITDSSRKETQCQIPSVAIGSTADLEII